MVFNRLKNVSRIFVINKDGLENNLLFFENKPETDYLS